jgi:uncharacterized protein DUF1194
MDSRPATAMASPCPSVRRNLGRPGHGRLARLLAVCSCALGVAGGVPGAAAAGAGPGGVDLALVLALDVSGTVSQGRFDLQRKGYAEAFASPELVDAIRSVEGRAVAVTLVEWSGARQQEQVLAWTLIVDEASSKAFARRISEMPRSFYGRTSISEAIDFGSGLLANAPFPSARKIIDVSGDGPSNDGDAVAVARDKAVGMGLTINGLPIVADEVGLDEYYARHVIGGPDSFVIPVSRYEEFADAILRKLVREIAGIGHRLLMRAGESSPPPLAAGRVTNLVGFSVCSAVGMEPPHDGVGSAGLPMSSARSSRVERPQGCTLLHGSVRVASRGRMA